MREQYRKIARGSKGTVAKDVGDVDRGAEDRARRRFDVEYEMPYLAHACMEPLNATAQVPAASARCGRGTQNQSEDAALVAAALGLTPPEQ